MKKWRMVQAWEELQSYFPRTPQIHSEWHYRQMEKTCNNSEPSQSSMNSNKSSKKSMKNWANPDLDPVWLFFYVYKVISWAPGLHKERHYLQMAKTWNNSEPLQKWMTFQNSCKSDKSSRKSQNIQATPDLCHLNKRQHLWLTVRKPLGENGIHALKTTAAANPEEHEGSTPRWLANHLVCWVENWTL